MPAAHSGSIRDLRAQAIGRSLFAPCELRTALERLEFVQADPIRAPARAQDLILRHRVTDYRAGDLERCYPSLDLEEDYLYAYGFLPRRVRQLLHPRRRSKLSRRDAQVLAAVAAAGTVHPRDLHVPFGRARVVNAWGGYSQATKAALERLHHRGLTRVARREAGIRIYEACPPQVATLSRAERLRELIVVVARVLEPVPQRTLGAIAAHLRRSLQTEHRAALHGLLQAGRLERRTVDGISYLSTARIQESEEPPRSVRFLAPFDPVVWDRLRFEHLWGWAYRFEAYTPPAKRVRGYYALPLLWADAVIGWANVGRNGGALQIELGFVEQRPKSAAFRRELDAEIARLEVFLSEKPAHPSIG
ncbi:MAG: DNA glycosylase AlkZ-like family protein [Vulcanimicrobiaceae bacterium]